MGHLIPFYMLMNAGYENNVEDDAESTSSSDKPLENKSITSSKMTDGTEVKTKSTGSDKPVEDENITSSKTVDDTEVKTETRVPSKPVENYDKGLQNGMFFSGIVIGAMLMFFIMMFYNEYKAKETKMEALERKIRELEMEGLYKNHRGFNYTNLKSNIEYDKKY